MLREQGGGSVLWCVKSGQAALAEGVQRARVSFALSADCLRYCGLLDVLLPDEVVQSLLRHDSSLFTTIFGR